MALGLRAWGSEFRMLTFCSPLSCRPPLESNYPTTHHSDGVASKPKSPATPKRTCFYMLIDMDTVGQFGRCLVSVCR